MTVKKKIKSHIQPKITTQQETSDRSNAKQQKSILSSKTEEKEIGCILSTSSDK